MKIKTRFKVRVNTKGRNTSYNPTFRDVLQDRISHLDNYEKPTFYNKKNDPERNFQRSKT